MTTSNFNPTPLYRLIEKTDFLCFDNKDASNEVSHKVSHDVSIESSTEAGMMSCFNPKDFYRLIVDKEYVHCSENEVPENLKRTYVFDPTKLYKLIETKSWDKVMQRVLEYPEEAAIWVTRVKKDGSLRWKMLPLHALILLKAPKEVILRTLQSFPEAAKCADDQGMLPMHLALINDDTDDLIIKSLMKENLKGLLSKDKFGRTPLALRGKVTVSCFDTALALEITSISKREKESSEFKLSSENELHNKKIKEIEDGVNALFRDFTGSEIESIEQRDMVSMQENEILEIMKLSQIGLVSQNDSSEHSLEIQKKNLKKAWLHALTTQQNREINKLNQKVKERSKKISELEISKKAMRTSLKGQKETSSNLQRKIDDLNRNISRLQNKLMSQSEMSSHVDIMKRQQHAYELLASQIENLEIEYEKRSLNPGKDAITWTKNAKTFFDNITSVE